MDDIMQLKMALDSRDMYGMIAGMPDHLEEGLAIGRSVDLRNLEAETFHSVLVAGMGGSAIAGDIAKSYLLDQLDIPLWVCRHYDMPEFVNKRTLVIASSYSGNTEETLSAYDRALDRGARVIAISTGGKLAEKAAADDVPLMRIKPGLQPRAALGYSLAPLLMVLSRFGLCQDQGHDILVAAASMRRWAKAYAPDSVDNPALQLARELRGTIPIIYAGYDRFDAVAYRFKCQVNENAETPAFANVFPEFNHNELVGYRGLYGLNDTFSVVILRDNQDHRRIKARMDIVTLLLKEKGIKVLTLESHPGSELERIFYFIQLLDFASYYMALLNGLDPYPVQAIDHLKNELSKVN
ncbi:MAG: bifunctional phosphoglucose/phosphomannose isomerase [candidate division Zixibacteria bacterium RBG_16_53_22]|nr:MAG: bifunctional phosphoglucose/phosphomannose isomerase [candidate division Zixibacteria bacterium RBG_16_53_22]